MRTLIALIVCAALQAGEQTEHKPSTGNGATGSWVFSNYGSSNPFGETRLNEVWVQGYNAGPNNAKIVAEEPSCATVIESFYALDTTYRVIETYTSIKERNGTEHRPAGFIYWRNGAAEGQINGHIATQSFSWFNNSMSSQYMIYNVGNAANAGAELLLCNGTVLNSYTNNSPFIGQQNAAGTARRSLIYLDNSDKVTLGGSGDDTRVAGHLKTDPNKNIEVGAGGAFQLSPDASLYVSGTKLVVKFNDAGVLRYRSLELAGTAITLEYSTTAP